MSAESNAAGRCDRLWHNARLLTLAADSGELQAGKLCEVHDGIVACRAGTVVFAGPRARAPEGLDAIERIDCDGRLITPGLIDCHTHLVYAGQRADEFERRLAGESYEDIARAGGGIASSVRATRAASETELVADALPRLDALLAEGVTTVEIKSGYGLSLEHERKQLKVIRTLAQLRPLEVRATFLGAHALPPGMGGAAAERDAYVREVCEVMLPALAREGLVDAVDAFCERIGFTLEQTRRVLEAATEHGLPVKLHAEQLSNSHGAALAAAYGALSADHLEYLDEPGVAALARARTTAVLLPGAYYFTRETQPPPIASLRAHGVPIALATDCNPGTSPLGSILLAMNMAATLFRLTVAECLAGVTRVAAQALGLGARTGSLERGKACDLAIWNVAHAAELVYFIGRNPLHARVWRGR